MNTLIPLSLVVCHGGPAVHFTAIQKALASRGFEVEIHASGPAADQLTKMGVRFTRFDAKSEGAAAEVAGRVKNAAIVITDVGEVFDEGIQRHLECSTTPHLAYYDNPLDYVPGWSTNAARVIKHASGALFANANLVSKITADGSTPVDLKGKSVYGVGYYPFESAIALKERRGSDRCGLKQDLFNALGIEDPNREVVVYFGGNTEHYFNTELPLLLKLVEEGAFGNRVVLLQQHPGAKASGRETALVKDKIHLSPVNSETAMLLADYASYSQTSMAPQFLILEIPTIQIGGRKDDPFIQKGAVVYVSSKRDLEAAFQNPPKKLSQQEIKGVLGAKDDWEEALANYLKSLIHK